MKVVFYKYLIFPLLILVGFGFVYRLMHIPSRMETAIFCIAFFLIPTLKYPKLGVYYLFCLPLFIPVFRRLYYLVSERPTLDYLMLISDGVMGGLIMALILLWILNKERSKDIFSTLVVVYVLLLFAKVFLGRQGSLMEGLYGFKFNGLYVFFFFAGSYIISSYRETRAIIGYTSWLLFLTALYGIKQVLFGFSGFEQKWLDSITFTTLRIDGVVRPFSTYVSPAAMSDGMVILLIMGIFWVVAKGRYTAPFGIMLSLSSIVPIMIATVRTNWLAAGAGLFFYGVLLRLQKTWVKWAVIMVMLAGIAGVAARGGGGGGSGGGSFAQNAAISAAVNKKSPDLTETMIKNRTAALANPLQEYSVQKRMETWAGIMYMSLHFPLGKGQGTTGYAHSYYFLILGEIGYPGLICFLAIVFVGFYRGMKVISHSKDKETAELMRLLVTIVFMLSVLNLTGTHLHTPPGDIFFWFSMGCISRFYRQWKEEDNLVKAAEMVLEGNDTESRTARNKGIRKTNPSGPGGQGPVGQGPVGQGPGGPVALPGGSRA